MILMPRRPKKVHLALGSADMRKAINGLSIMVETMGLDPFCGDLFAFCNSQRTMIKILYWDRNGFCLWHKRLEKHCFKWPESAEQVMMVSAEQLSWLLAGLDFTRAHQRLHYSALS